MNFPGGSLPIRIFTSWPRRRSAAAWFSACSTTPPQYDQENGTTMPIFMRRTAANARASRSMPSSSVSSVTASESARPAGAARAEALARRDGDAVLGEQPLGGQPFGQPQPDVERPFADGRLRQRARRARRGGARRWRRARRRSPAGRSSAAIAACCSGAKIPTRAWSLSRLTRSTISAFPTTKPIRQPAMPYVFDIDHISTPTSFAPGVARKLCGRAAVEDEVDVRGVVDDRRRRCARPRRPRPRRRRRARRPRTGSTGS